VQPSSAGTDRRRRTEPTRQERAMDTRHQTLRLTAARYIAGSLTAEERQQFEAGIRAQPGLVAELGIDEQLQCALQLLDGGEVGRRLPWWRTPAACFTALGTAAVLAIALGVVLWRWDMAVDRQRVLEAQAEQRFLAPTSGSETLKIDPQALQRYSVSGAASASRIELHIAMRTLKFNQFRVNLARGDGTFVAQANRLVRDSNGNLRLAFNSSLLPAGDYELRVEGLTWRGEAVPLERVVVALRR